jgi:hypothetical protein
MRFMFIAKSPHSGPPTPELLKAMDKLAEQDIKAGCLLDHRGLMPRVPNHSNATTPIGLDDRGMAEVDLDAERRLDVWKVRSVQPKPGQVGPQLRKLEP